MYEPCSEMGERDAQYELAGTMELDKGGFTVKAVLQHS